MTDRSPVSRRKLLVASAMGTVVAASGCHSLGSTSAEAPNDNDQTDEENPSNQTQEEGSDVAETSYLQASLADVADTPPDADIEYRVELVSSRMGGGETVHFIVTVENVSDDRIYLYVGASEVVQFGYSDPAGLMVLTGNFDPEWIHTKDCWTYDFELTWNEGTGPRIWLRPGQTRSQHFTHVGDWDEIDYQDCPDPGTYRFEDTNIRTYDVIDGDDGLEQGDERDVLEWGLDLELVEIDNGEGC